MKTNPLESLLIGGLLAFSLMWLPGTEGLGVTDVLFGDFKPTGKLSRAWLQVAEDSKAEPAFPFGFGMSFKRDGLSESQPVKSASVAR